METGQVDGLSELEQVLELQYPTGSPESHVEKMLMLAGVVQIIAKSIVSRAKQVVSENPMNAVTWRFTQEEFVRALDDAKHEQATAIEGQCFKIRAFYLDLSTALRTSPVERGDAASTSTGAAVAAASISNAPGTLRDLGALRRTLHMSLIENVVRQVKRDVDELQSSAIYQQRKVADPTGLHQDQTGVDNGDRIAASVVEEVDAVLHAHRSKHADFFNDDHNHSKLLGEATKLRGNAMSKLHYWLDNAEVWASDHKGRSMKDAVRLAYGRRVNKYLDAKECGDVIEIRRHARQLCIDEGFMEKDVDEVGDDGESALHLAAGSGNVRAIKLLVDAGADVNTLLDNAGNSALILACRGGMHECVAALLEARADANQRGQGGKSALISAAECGYNRAISLLLQAGGEVNGGDDNGFTPLMWATQNNQTACVQRLLQNGACVNVSSADGWTALFDAAMSGSLEAAQLRQLLVAAGINVNAARSSGAAPLHMSCLYAPPHSTELVRFLLESKADVKGNEHAKKIPLLAAVEKGSAGVVRVLVEHGARVTSATRMALYSCENEEIRHMLAGQTAEEQVDISNLAAGTQVLARYTDSENSAWFDAKIVSRSADSSYCVEWDDGDTQHTESKRSHELKVR